MKFRQWYYFIIVPVALVLGWQAGYSVTGRGSLFSWIHFNPHTTDNQKLNIRTVQLNLTNADKEWRSSPKFVACVTAPVCKDMLDSQELNNYINAYNNFTNTTQAIFSADKADPAKWQLDPNLDFAPKPPTVMNQPQAANNGLALPAPQPVPAVAPASTPVAKPATTSQPPKK